jgi:hypothetical protein
VAAEGVAVFGTADAAGNDGNRFEQARGDGHAAAAVFADLVEGGVEEGGEGDAGGDDAQPIVLDETVGGGNQLLFDEVVDQSTVEGGGPTCSSTVM